MQDFLQYLRARDKAFVPRGESRVMIGDRLIVIALPGAIPLVGELSG